MIKEIKMKNGLVYQVRHGSSYIGTFKTREDAEKANADLPEEKKKSYVRLAMQVNELEKRIIALESKLSLEDRQ